MGTYLEQRKVFILMMAGTEKEGFWSDYNSNSYLTCYWAVGLTNLI
jgi:hypothetical protein